jgi:hypothetical protein
MTNAELLRRALTALDISGVELARRLTAVRDDGKATEPPTVSRWLTGASTVPGGLMGNIRELLRAKLQNAPMPVKIVDAMALSELLDTVENGPPRTCQLVFQCLEADRDGIVAAAIAAGARLTS